MSDNTKFGNGIDLTPITNDPANPVDGGIYYFDGTNRAKGIWTYDGAGFVQSGEDAPDDKSITKSSNYVVAETGKTNFADMLLQDSTSVAGEVVSFFNVPSAATTMGATLDFDYTLDNLTGVSGNLEVWMYEVGIQQNFPISGADQEKYNGSQVYFKIGEIALSSLTTGNVLSTASVTLNALDFSAVDSGSGAKDLRGERIAIALTAPYLSVGVQQLPASAGLNIKTVDYFNGGAPDFNPERYAFRNQGFNKSTYNYSQLGGNFGYGAGSLQMAFTINVDASKSTIPQNAIGSVNLGKESIKTSDIAEGSITQSRLADDSVTASKLAAGATDSVAANRSLSNLTSPALVNATLLPDDENARRIGQSTTPWLEMVAKTFEISDGTNTRYDKTWTGAAVTEGLTSGISRKSVLNAPTRYVEEHYIDALTINASQANAILLTLDGVDFEGVTIDYKVKTSTGVKHGTIKIATDSTAVAITDVSTELNSSDVTFNAQMNGTDVEITYSSVAAGTMVVDMKKFQA